MYTGYLPLTLPPHPGSHPAPSPCPPPWPSPWPLFATAVYLHEGLHYHPFNLHPRTAGQRKMYRYLMSTRHSLVETLFTVIYLGIVFFEKPAGV